MEYKQAILAAVDRQDLPAIEQLAADAFADPAADEVTLSWVAAFVFERQIASRYTLIGTFIDRFPHSLHLMRLYYADLLTRQNQFDAAATEARIYLRNLFETGIVAQDPDNLLVQEALGRGLLLLTSVYTEVGARSYSRRVLEFGAPSIRNQHWQRVHATETERLIGELSDANNQTLDQQWEAFWRDGSGVTELMQLCDDKHAPDLKKRLGLLEGKFRYNADFRIDNQEILLLVYQGTTEDKTFWLG